jgi:tripartite-type tricarboxylate transporter receptor subunit TctC
MKARRIVSAAGLLMIGAIAATTVVRADAWPTRPLTIIAPAAPGGTSDLFARLLAEGLARELGQNVIVDNRPGAGTNIGNQAVARAAPDGYTLLLGMTTLAVNPHLYKDLPYDPQRDLKPIRLLGQMHNVVVVPATSSVTTLKSLIGEAQARPGAMNYASPGKGTSVHLATELFKSMSATDMMHVPYKSSALSAAAVMSGETHVAFENMPVVLGAVKAGRLRAIAVTGAKRSANLPDVPTVAEAGLAGYEVTGWFGLVAPAATPPEIVRRLDEATRRFMTLPQTQERIRTMGAEPADLGPADFAAMVRAENAKWGDVIRKANLRME